MSDTLERNNLSEIPSEYIEPYLVAFMGTMVEMFAFNTEKLYTTDELKQWVKGVEFFVSCTCGIHARTAMMNGMYKMTELPNEKLKEICKGVVMGKTDEE